MMLWFLRMVFLLATLHIWYDTFTYTAEWLSGNQGYFADREVARAAAVPLRGFEDEELDATVKFVSRGGQLLFLVLYITFFADTNLERLFGAAWFLLCILSGIRTYVPLQVTPGLVLEWSMAIVAFVGLVAVFATRPPVPLTVADGIEELEEETPAPH